MFITHTFRSIFIILIASLLYAAPVEARKRTSRDVRRDRQKTEQQITQTQKQISDNDKETARQLNRLNLINATLNLRADTIRGIQARIDSVNANIKVLNDSIATLTGRSQTLKANYAKTLRTMRSRRQAMSGMAFIFSAKSFSQAWRRIRYLREIAKASTRQAKQIKATSERLTAARQQLDALKAEHSSSLASLNSAQATMTKERASADKLVAGLRQQGKSLNRELSRRQRQAAELERELNKVVEQEIREAEARRIAEEKARREAEEKARREAEEKRLAEERAAKAAREAEQKAKTAKPEQPKKDVAETKPSKQPKPTPAKESAKEPAKKPAKSSTPAAKPTPAPKPAYASTADADRKLTGSFASNKGRLLFPVAGKYTITSNFGTYSHPDFSKVKMNNLGIDVEVPRGTSTRAVFEGVVSSIFRLDGYHNVVIVRHGEYLTVYAGIDALAVKKGDKVRAGQNLGSLFSDPDDGGRTSLHFEIRHEKQKLNPTEWVR